VSSLCLSNNKKFICSGGMYGEVRIWEIRSKEMISNLKEHIQKVSKVQIFSNDLHLLSAAKDKSILVWDLAKEKRIASYQISMGGVNNFELSPIDENILVTVGQDRKITHWDLRQPRPVKIISSDPYNKLDQADELFGLAISNDGKYLATGGTAGIIRIWDVNSGFRFIEENYAHSKTITALAFSYDDKFLLSTGEDSMILAFNNKTGNNFI
jgi:WD40 repeat protein